VKKLLRKINPFATDAFGHYLLIKRLLFLFVGFYTYIHINVRAKTNISGTEYLRDLPATGVLFVSNHQTYFADVMAMMNIFCSLRWRFRNKISSPIYLLNPRFNIYFIAAEETMRTGLLPKMFAYAGAVTIQRTWREGEKDINRQVRFSDLSNIGRALEDGWVINFPQGTTKPNAPARRGVAHIIKKHRPIVVPVVVDGFRDTFDKRGLKLRKRGGDLFVRFKEPLTMDYDADSDSIIRFIMDAIEQYDAGIA